MSPVFALDTFIPLFSKAPVPTPARLFPLRTAPHHPRTSSANVLLFWCLCRVRQVIMTTTPLAKSWIRAWITHLQRFSDDEIYANWTRTAAPPHGCMREPSYGATVRGQFAYISLSEKRCNCVIIHNISVHLCIMYVLIMYLNSVYICCTQTIWIVK